jgi:hypothetical protein
VVRGVLRARHEHAGVLQRLDAGRQPAALLVRPRVELLAEHDAGREGAGEGVRGRGGSRGGERGVGGGEREPGGARERVQVVAGLPARDGGRVAVVALERGDLGAEHGRGGVAVVVDEPVVDARGEVGEGVGGQRRGERPCGGVRARGHEGGGRGEGGEDRGRARQRPRALRPRRTQLVRVGAGRGGQRWRRRRRRRRGDLARRRRPAERREVAARGEGIHGRSRSTRRPRVMCEPLSC